MRLTCITLVIALGGCSLVFMPHERSGPLEPGQVRPEPCTTERDIPWWDAIIGTTEGAVGLTVLIVALAGGSDSRGSGVALGLIGMGLGAAHGYSAHKGFGWANECEKLQRSEASLRANPAVRAALEPVP